MFSPIDCVNSNPHLYMRVRVVSDEIMKMLEKDFVVNLQDISKKYIYIDAATIAFCVEYLKEKDYIDVYYSVADLKTGEILPGQWTTPDQIPSEIEVGERVWTLDELDLVSLLELRK